MAEHIKTRDIKNFKNKIYYLPSSIKSIHVGNLFSLIINLIKNIINLPNKLKHIDGSIAIIKNKKTCKVPYNLTKICKVPYSLTKICNLLITEHKINNSLVKKITIK